MSLEKITLYKEMLLVEPASKIFFSLAKLLCDASKNDDAIEVLEKGIMLNPEYLEARLFLIELLSTKGDNKKQNEHVDKIISLFSSYTTFLKAWNEKISSVDTEMSIALSLLSSSLSNENISLNTVLQYGFQALKGMKVPQKNTAKDAAHIISRKEDIYGDEFEDEEYVEEIGEPIVRTRSMADLLLEQGAVEEALTIYKELYEKEKNKKQEKELLKIISSLENELTFTNEKTEILVEGKPSNDRPPMAEDTKHKIITTLAALVERLDARAEAISPK